MPRPTQAQLRHEYETKEGRAAAESLCWRFVNTSATKSPTPEMVKAAAWFLSWAGPPRAFEEAFLAHLGLEWFQDETGGIHLAAVARAAL